MNEDDCIPKASNDFSRQVCAFKTVNISENSAFMKWKVSLQSRTSASVLSVAYHWCQFRYSPSFVNARCKSLAVFAWMRIRLAPIICSIFAYNIMSYNLFFFLVKVSPLPMLRTYQTQPSEDWQLCKNMHVLLNKCLTTGASLGCGCMRLLQLICIPSEKGRSQDEPLR